MTEGLQIEIGRDAPNKSRSRDAERRWLLDARARSRSARKNQRLGRGCCCPASRRDSEDFKRDAQSKVALVRKYDNINWQDPRHKSRSRDAERRQLN